MRVRWTQGLVVTLMSIILIVCPKYPAQSQVAAPSPPDPDSYMVVGKSVRPLVNPSDKVSLRIDSYGTDILLQPGDGTGRVIRLIWDQDEGLLPYVRSGDTVHWLTSNGKEYKGRLRFSAKIANPCSNSGDATHSPKSPCVVKIHNGKPFYTCRECQEDPKIRVQGSTGSTYDNASILLKATDDFIAAANTLEATSKSGSGVVADRARVAPLVSEISLVAKKASAIRRDLADLVNDLNAQGLPSRQGGQGGTTGTAGQKGQPMELGLVCSGGSGSDSVSGSRRKGRNNESVRWVNEGDLSGDSNADSTGWTVDTVSVDGSNLCPGAYSAFADDTSLCSTTQDLTRAGFTFDVHLKGGTCVGDWKCNTKKTQTSGERLPTPAPGAR